MKHTAAQTDAKVTISERDRWDQHSWGHCKCQFLFNRETFTFPKVPGRTFFPNLSKSITWAASPSVLTPFCPQPTIPRGHLLLLRESGVSERPCRATIGRRGWWPTPPPIPLWPTPIILHSSSSAEIVAAPFIGWSDHNCMCR